MGIYRGTNGDDSIQGNDGAHWFIHNGQWLYSSNGNDKIYAYDGRDTVSGGAGDDEIYGYGGADLLNGDEGNDRVYGGTGDDTVFGGDGNDKLYGYLGNDKLYGGDGNDTAYGSFGNDEIYGGKGSDLLLGEDGNDYLRGTSGGRVNYEYDTLTGGSGADDFSLGNGSVDYLGAGYALITDFNSLEGDEILLPNLDQPYISGNNNLYSLEIGNWHGGSAQDTRILYDGDWIAIVQDTQINSLSDLTFVDVIIT